MSSYWLSIGRFLLALGPLAAELSAQTAQTSSQDDTKVFAESLDWNRVVRGFRHDHNFAIGLAYAGNEWKGYLQRTSEEFSAETQGLEVQVDYSFHLPLYGSIGYTLGTGGAYIFREAGTGTQAISVKQSYSLPGINLGLVWNISERWRTTLSFVYGWQRIERMEVRTAFARENVALTGDVRSWRWSFDYFLQLSLALRLEVEDFEFSYTSEESLDLKKWGKQIHLGLVKHLI